MLRWKVVRYLKSQSRTSDFKADFSFPSAAEMAQKSAAAPGDGESGNLLTGKDFDTLCLEYFKLKTAAFALERDVLSAEDKIKETAAEIDALAKKQAEPGGADSADTTSRLALLQAKLDVLKNRLAGRAELQTKEEAIAPIVHDLWAWQRSMNSDDTAADAASGGLAAARAEFMARMQQKLSASASYSEIYRVIGQELWVASRLLDSKNPEHRRAALRIVYSAGRVAARDAQNGWLAARICEAYLLPNWSIASDTDRRSQFSLENFLTDCAEFFKSDNETANTIRVYRIAIDHGKNALQADWGRARIAAACEQSGDLKQAVQYIRQIQNTNDYRALIRRLPKLEQMSKTR
jgi:hypothetical protein